MTDLRQELTRRSALTATAVVGGGALLSACGDGGSATKVSAVDITVKASEVPVGGGFVDKKNAVVVTQPTKGSFKAFSAVCTHQGCVVGSVSKEAITCGCHGSQFDPASGAVKAGPAEKALPAKKVAPQGDSLHITG